MIAKDKDGSIVTYEWTTDGATVADSSQTSIALSYDVIGPKRVQLVVTDNDGATAAALYELQVVCRVMPQISTEVANPQVGQEVRMKALSNCEQATGSFQWNFDADGKVDAIGDSVVHVFLKPGQQKVELAFVDSIGNRSVAFMDITVSKPANQAPTLRIHRPITALHANEQFLIDASASTDDGRIVEFRWDVDNDGSIDAKTSKPELLWTFARPATYTVRVVAVDDQGAESSALLTFRILPGLSQGLSSPSYVGASISLLGTTPMLRVMTGLSLQEQTFLGISFGYAKGAALHAGYTLATEFWEFGLHGFISLNQQLLIGAGGGILTVQGRYAIDWPVLGSDRFSLYIPFVSVSGAFRLGYFLVSLGVNFAP